MLKKAIRTTFLQAAALLAKERNDVRFVCVGNGCEPCGHELALLGDNLKLGRKLTWAGPRVDMPTVYNAFDICCCSSSAYGEGFSNVVGEAMACGVPCVVTDVGDSAYIVGETGVVVPPEDPQAMADGWKSILRLPEEERRSLGQAALVTIVSQFGRDRLVERTETVLIGLL